MGLAGQLQQMTLGRLKQQHRAMRYKQQLFECLHDEGA